MKILTKSTVITPLVISVLFGLTACTDRTADKSRTAANGNSASNYAAAPALPTTAPTTDSTTKPETATAPVAAKPAGSADAAAKSAPTTQKDSAASTTLSDHQIASVIKDANDAEFGAGALAKTRAENPQVRAFARHMIDEHKKNNSVENAFAKKWDASSSENDISKNIRAEASAKLAELEKISGSDFEQAYIQNQLAMHKQLLDDLDHRYIPAAQDAKLKSFLKETRKHVSNHLTSAQALASMLER